LVDGGADVNCYCLKDRKGKKIKSGPLDIAELHKLTDIAEYLKSKGAKRFNNDMIISIEELEAITFPAGEYCVPVVYKTDKTSSISYSCLYVNVTTTKNQTYKEIVNAARNYIKSEFKLNKGNVEQETLVLERNCQNCKKIIEAKYVLSDFQVLYTTLK
jgi:hypothetical protein